jgi:acyl-CoA thioesterase-1
MIHGVAGALLLGALGCGGSSDRAAPDSAAVPPADAAAQGPAAGDGRPGILFLGTSLTAGLGLEPDSAYPAVIQRKLDSLGLPWRALNSGVSGETSAGALRRLAWVLQPPVRVLVIETGANDGLRGIEPESTRANITAIVARARAWDASLVIVLAGMEAPPNMGPQYTGRFRRVFQDLARTEGLPLIPFLLDGVGGVDSLNQADGIHPTAPGARIVADNVWRTLEPVLRRAAAAGPAAGAGR